jgi:hypothetical protein
VPYKNNLQIIAMLNLQVIIKEKAMALGMSQIQVNNESFKLIEEQLKPKEMT